MDRLIKNRQYYKFCFYGFLKNLRFFDAFFILFLRERGLTFTEIGILYAVREVVMNVSEIPSGIIADTYGRKRALLGSFLLYIFSFLVFYFSGGFWLFLLAFTLYGIADAFRSGTHKGMIMDYLKLNRWEEQKINYYGHTRAWSQMGSAISALLAGLIVFCSGTYQNIFLFSVIPYLLNLLLIASYPVELNGFFEPKQSRTGRGVRFTLAALVKTIRQPKVLEIINTTAFHSAYLKAVKDYIQPLIVNVALLIPIMISDDAEKRNGVVVGLIYFIIYFLTARASQLSSKVAVRNKRSISFRTLFLGFIFGIVSGALYIYGFWILSLVAFAGIFIVENIRKPILTGFIADQVPNEILTSVISAQSFIRTLITAILALIFGIVADHFGLGVSVLTVSLFLSVITMMIKGNTRIHNKRRLVK